MGIPILRFLFRKMWNTRWLTLSSLAGLIIAVSFITSIPMYADGSLKRVVSTTLEEQSQGYPAGSLLIRYQAIGSDRASREDLEAVNQYIAEDIPQAVGFPYDNFVPAYSLRNTEVSPVDPSQVDASKRRQMTLAYRGGLEENIEIVQGRLIEPRQDGVIEVLVMEENLFRNDFRIGDRFYYPVRGAGSPAPLQIEVVGAFEPKPVESARDAYWYQGLESIVNTVFVSEDTFWDELIGSKQLTLDTANWYYQFDLREIQTSQLSPLSRTLERMDIELYQRLTNTRVDHSFAALLNDFRSQSLQMQSLLFTLAAPMIAMVFYFIIMNSRQSLDRQRNDIAVLRSRGASNRQIIRLYIYEGLLLGGISLIAGPLIGWFMAKSIGSSNGFLTFVNREAIPVDVNVMTLLYGALAVLVALIASIIPAIQFARSTIVGLRKEMARADRKPFWMRWYLDIALLALSAYGWYLFNERQYLSLQTGLSSDQMQVQPLLFFVPAITIFSIGLFFLRVFPLILKLLYAIGRKYLPVSLYVTMVQLSRSAKGYYSIMLLLVLTLGLGVYNASAARTIDLNTTERTQYAYGTDVVMSAVWEGFAELPDPPRPPENPGEGGSGGGGAPSSPPGGDFTPPPRIIYSEPPFQVFQDLPGVEHASRVLTIPGNATVSGRTAGRGTVMGIDNVDFAEVAWLERRDLFPAHPNHYLNYLGMYEHSVLVSESFAERHQLKPGDLISISIEQQSLEFVIMGILPYWPSLYPDEAPFFIVNLDYLYDQLPMIPYDVWIKMEDNAMLTPAVEELANQGIQLATVKDVRNELIIQSRHPSRGGVFGILSLGFLVSVLVSLTGYILYWFFNLSSRVVQFGVLRAMGLSRKQLTGMLLMEQLFTAGLSIALGIGIGKLASYLYLPFLQTTGNASLQVPPFRIIFDSRDTMQLYIIVGVMMLIGAGLLFFHIRRLKVHQAVKLGEEG